LSAQSLAINSYFKSKTFLSALLRDPIEIAQDKHTGIVEVMFFVEKLQHLCHFQLEKSW
jgi:hypothetical protein